jgi:hypothetical protein
MRKQRGPKENGKEREMIITVVRCCLAENFEIYMYMKQAMHAIKHLLRKGQGE